MQDPLNPKATLGQIENLVTAIGRTGNIKNDFEDYENQAYEALSGISSKHCAYLNMLVVKNKIFDLKNILTQRGLKIIY